MAQLDRVASLAAMDNVHIGVLPIDGQAVAAPWSNFVIYEGEETFVMVELVHAGVRIADPEDVELYRGLYDRLGHRLDQAVHLHADRLVFEGRAQEGIRESAAPAGRHPRSRRDRGCAVSPVWVDTISTATRAPIVILIAAMCIYLALVAIVTLVALLHPDADRREDARKVLVLLLAAAWPGRRR